MKINPLGYWENDKPVGHHHDKTLAKAIVKLSTDYNVATALDLGCGTGEYSRKLFANGIYVEAYDGNPHTPQLTGGIGSVLDFSQEFDLDEGFDLVLSLEVGEHIPEEFEQVFLGNIVRHCYKGGLIILSWAIPGQAGDGHVNCRSNDYIIEQMNNRGWAFNAELSRRLRDASSLPWFQKTLMVFE